jgi:hypothetical protein
VSRRVVGVLAYPLGEDFGVGVLRNRSLRRAYRRTLLNKANPRSPQYMRELFAERCPDGEISDDVPARADEIVLLYPDAIGLGFGAIERRLPPGVAVRLLNGRRREFALDPPTRRALKRRRLLERAMLGELVALAAAAAVTPLLLVADLVRGRT